MQTREEHLSNSRRGIPPLMRRFSLRIRCARPRHTFGQKEETNQETYFGSGLMSWQRAARFRRTLVVVQRKELFPTLEPRERKRRDSHRGLVDKSGLGTG